MKSVISIPFIFLQLLFITGCYEREGVLGDVDHSKEVGVKVESEKDKIIEGAIKDWNGYLLDDFNGGKNMLLQEVAQRWRMSEGKIIKISLGGTGNCVAVLVIDDFIEMVILVDRKDRCMRSPFVRRRHEYLRIPPSTYRSFPDLF